MATTAAPPANPPTASLWRWSLAIMLVWGFALLSPGTAPTQTEHGQLEQNLAVGNPTGSWANQPELWGPGKRTLLTEGSGGDQPFSIGLTHSLSLLAALLLVGLRQYGYQQLNLISSPANRAPCSPRAPPALQTSV